MITFDAETQCFHLRGAQVSYVMQVEEDGQIHHLYWGDALGELPKGMYDRAPYRRAALVEHQMADSPKCSREYRHYECPTYGLSDFRLPALATEEEATEDALCDLRYAEHCITQGRTPLAGLPFADGGTEAVETLSILLRDPCNGVQVTLYYHLFPEESVITRHMVVHNAGSGTV